MPVFIVPVAANHERSTHAVARFIRPGPITPDAGDVLEQLAVVTNPAASSSPPATCVGN